MKYNFKLSLLVGLIFLFWGCQQKKEIDYDENGMLIKRTYFDNGNIEQEGTYLNDTMRDGWRRGYYENGKLKYSSEYKKGVQNGWTIYYYENGHLKSKTHYLNDLPDGKSFVYDSNANIKSESNWLHGIQAGNSKFYYPNSTQIESYYSNDLDGHAKYIRKYDPTGKIREDKGRILTQFLLEGNFDSVKVGKVIKAGVLIAEPPNTKTRIFMGEINNHKDIIGLKEYTKRIKECIVPCEEKVFTSPGNYKIVVIGIMKDINNEHVKNDTIIIDMRAVK